MSSFTNLTGKHQKGFGLCNEEATVFNQTSPMLGIRYQDSRLKSLCLDSLAPDFTYLPVTRGQPPQLSAFIYTSPTPTPLPKHLWMIMPELSMPQESLLTGYSLTLLFEVMFWFLNFRDNGRQEQRGLSERTFTSIQLKEAYRSKTGQIGQPRWKTCGLLPRRLHTALGLKY